MQPLLYAACAAAAGIVAAAYLPRVPPTWEWFAGGALLMALAWAGTITRRRWVRGLAIVLALGGCAALGGGRARGVQLADSMPKAQARQLALLQPGVRDRVWITGYLRDDPDAQLDGGQTRALRLDVEIQSFSHELDRGPFYAASGGARLYSYAPARAGDEEEDAAAPMAVGAWPGGLAQLHAGDGIAVQAHLRGVVGYHDPGVADFTAAARREGIAYTGSIASDSWQAWPAEAGPRVAAARAAIWSWMSRRVDLLAPPRSEPEVNALLRGMLLGDIERLDAGTREAFQIDGVYHLLVVAGLHLGVLAGILFGLLRWCGLRRGGAGLAVLALLGLYAWIIAGRTPTLRALLMMAVYAAARWWFRDRQPLNAVGGAALVLLAAHPLDLLGAGFQMSVGAALLLAGVALPLMRRSSGMARQAAARLEEGDFAGAGLPPRWARMRRRWEGWAERLGGRAVGRIVQAVCLVFDVALISLVLQVGFAAFNALYFHRANPWSVVANAVLVPAAGVMIPLGWAAMAMSALLPAGVIVRAARAVLAWWGNGMLHAAAGMAHWPGAGWRVPSAPGWMLVLFAAAMAGWVAGTMQLEARKPRRGWGRWSAAVAVGAAAVVAWCPFAPRLPPGLSATMLDVGQGDAIFIAFPDGRTLLVDGGPRTARFDSGAEIVEPFLWSLGLRRIDAVLLTHAHNDHIGGLEAVVRDFHPGEVWLTATLPTEAAMGSLLRTAAAAQCRLRFCRAGDSYRAGNCLLQVLSPAPTYRAGAAAANSDSMTVRVSYGASAMLLTGDTEAAGEDWMLAHHEPLESQLLKVGHHGSHTSTTPDFLAAVRPQVAIISDGVDNRYGHPAPEVVARLERTGVRVFRTDQDGAIQCRMDGSRMEVYLFARAPGAAR